MSALRRASFSCSNDASSNRSHSVRFSLSSRNESATPSPASSSRRGDDARLSRRLANIVKDEWLCWHSTLRKCLAEFVGVFLFVFIGSLSFSVTSVGPLAAAFAHGFTIVILVISLGHVRQVHDIQFGDFLIPQTFLNVAFYYSGGHFNPVVTLGVLISGNINPILAMLYVVTHLISAILSGFFLKAVLTNQAYCEIAGGTTNPHVLEETIPQGILLEMILTYLLVQSVLNAAIESGGTNLLAALAIGLSVLVDILAGNCSTKNGEQFKYIYVSPSDVWAAHYVDWVGPFLGALLAGLIYKMLLTSPQKSWFKNSFSSETSLARNEA